MKPSLFTLRSETALAGLDMIEPDSETMKPKGAEPAYQVSVHDFLCNPEGLGGLYLKLRALQIMTLHMSVLNWAHSGSIDANPDYLQALEAPWTSCLARVEQAPGHRPRGRPRAEAGVNAVLGSRAMAAAMERVFSTPVTLPYTQVLTRTDLKNVLMAAAGTPAGYEMLREMSFPSFMNENGILHNAITKGLMAAAENDLDGVTTVSPGTATCLLIPMLVCVSMPGEPATRGIGNTTWPAPIPLLGAETREGMSYDFHKLVRGLHIKSPEIVICNAGTANGGKKHTLQVGTKAPVWAYAIAKIDLPWNPFGAEASAYMPLDLREEHLKTVLKETAPWFTPRTSLARRLDSFGDATTNPVSAAAERYRMLSALSAWCRPMKAMSPFPGEDGAYLIDESPAWFSNSFLGVDREVIASICHAQTHHGERPPVGWFSPFCAVQKVMYAGARGPSAAGDTNGVSLEYKRMVIEPHNLVLPDHEETGGGDAIQIYPGYAAGDLAARYAATLDSPIRGDTGYGELGALGAGLRFLQEALLSRYIAGDLSRKPVVGCMNLRSTTTLGNGVMGSIDASGTRVYWHAQSPIVRGPGSWAWLPSTEVLDVMAMDSVLGAMIAPLVADTIESIDSYGDHPWAEAVRRAYANAVGILEVRNLGAEGKPYALRDVVWEAVPRDLSGLASALRQDATVKMSNRHRAVNRLMNRRAPTEKELSATRSYFDKHKDENVIWRQ